jgi:beta-1,4-N-acetylglucosaminyltransferase
MASSRKKRRNGKICLISSLGGHLQQIYQLKDLYTPYPHFFITTKGRSTIDKADIHKRMYFIADINEGRAIKNPLLLITAFFQTLVIFIKERPALIISTGAGVAIPGFILSKLFCIPSLYIEAFTRVKKPSMAGKIIYYLADRYLVQHTGLLVWLPRARYRGALYKYF